MRGVLLHSRACLFSPRAWRLAPGACPSPQSFESDSTVRWAATQLTPRPYGIVTNKQGPVLLDTETAQTTSGTVMAGCVHLSATAHRLHSPSMLSASPGCAFCCSLSTTREGRAPAG